MILDACPDLVDYAKGGIRNWRDFFATVAVVRPMPGISPSAWAEAEKVMGQVQAAVVVACILQRGTTDPVRRRVSAGAHAEGRGRGVLDRANPDGADQLEDAGKAVGVREAGHYTDPV